MNAFAPIQLAAPRFRRFTSAILLTSALLAWSALSVPAQAAMLAPEDGGPAGPKDWPADPASHVITIKREAKDDKQVAMITAAEAAQASQEALRKESAPKEPLDGNQPALPKEGNLWWYQEQLGLRIPYAITGDAVSYYSGIVTEYAKKGFKSYAKPSSRLNYQASVQFHEEFKLDGKTFKGVNVVTMELTFSANFTAEATSGLSLEKKRIVVLDAGNKVLHLSGDGPTEAAIMML
ncbi:MAG: hypothetical protein CFE26_02030 [Verrucomicrobiales bacterium VVV1]|nr:MAG: hypothetical protein CFE26_02030 [Verrucomicrobiales bacterium VVV1]